MFHAAGGHILSSDKICGSMMAQQVVMPPHSSCFDPQLGLLCAWSFACSPVCVGFTPPASVPPPFPFKHASRWIGYIPWCVCVWCPVMSYPGCVHTSQPVWHVFHQRTFSVPHKNLLSAHLHLALVFWRSQCINVFVLVMEYWHGV